MAKKKSSSKDGDFPEYRPTEYEAPQRNFLQEGREGLQLMHEAYPQLLDLSKKYGGQFATTEVDIAKQRSAAEAAAIKADGGALREGILGASPEIAAANAGMTARLGEMGPSGIETELKRQALGELQLGGRLSPEEQRGAQQAARAAWSARGMATGTPAAIAEVLNRQSFADARQAGRRAFAGGVDTMSTARRASDSAATNNMFNSLGGFWDPQQRMFGRGGSQVTGNVNPAAPFSPFLQGAQNVGQSNQDTALRTNAMNMAGDQFAQERMDTNWYTLFNAGETNANAAANRSNATKNAAIGAGASIMAMAALAFL